MFCWTIGGLLVAEVAPEELRIQVLFRVFPSSVLVCSEHTKQHLSYGHTYFKSFEAPVICSSPLALFLFFEG